MSERASDRERLELTDHAVHVSNILLPELFAEPQALQGARFSAGASVPRVRETETTEQTLTS